jgi:hypothetical protein
MEPAKDVDVAAAIVLAIRVEMLDHAEVVALLDSEILHRSDVPGWMLEASLTTFAEQLVSALDTVSFAHPLLSDPASTLEALGYALQSGRVDPFAYAERACRFLAEDLPGRVLEAVADLDEDAYCAHDYNGVPQPEAVSRSAAALAAATPGLSRWSRLIRSLITTRVTPQIIRGAG